MERVEEAVGMVVAMEGALDVISTTLLPADRVVRLGSRTMAAGIGISAMAAALVTLGTHIILRSMAASHMDNSMRDQDLTMNVELEDREAGFMLEVLMAEEVLVAATVVALVAGMADVHPTLTMAEERVVAVRSLCRWFLLCRLWCRQWCSQLWLPRTLTLHRSLLWRRL